MVVLCHRCGRSTGRNDIRKSVLVRPEAKTRSGSRFGATLRKNRKVENGGAGRAPPRNRLRFRRAKGYPKDWIEKRLRSIAIREELTGEWKQRGVKEGTEYAILTAEIAGATFGISPSAHATLKGLAKVKQSNNLRDHMTDLELIFTMLHEASTTEIARRKDARGFPANRRTAREGGTIAGDARRALEAKSGMPLISDSNHLGLRGNDAPDVLDRTLLEIQPEEGLVPPFESSKRLKATRPSRSNGPSKKS